jgi:poly(A) polymerase
MSLYAFLAEPRLAKLLEVMNPAGQTSLVAGGAVRNALMGEEPSDVDVATTMTPDQVIETAVKSGLKPVPTGYEHGTVTVLVDGEGFEMTTLREDVETDGRHARVKFGRSFEADAARRDFTMNALYLDRNGTVVDHVGGVADIETRRVRFVGDAERRVREDYLRILRFFRFHSAYATGAFDGAAHAAAVANMEGMARLSRERIRTELLKMMKTRRVADVCERMRADGFFDVLLPGLKVSTGPLQNAISAGLGTDDPFLRLAVLVTPAEGLGDLRVSLRLSASDGKRVAAMNAALVTSVSAITGAEDGGALERWARKAVYLHGNAAVADALVMGVANGLYADGTFRLAADTAGLTRPPRRPWKGADVVAMGVDPGEVIGEILAAATHAWIERDFPYAGTETDAILVDALNAAGSAPAP